jgi:hypothetical protein
MSRKALTAESWLWLWHRPNPKIDHFFASWNEPSKYLWHQTYCGPWLCFHVSERRIITKNRNRSCACLYRTTIIIGNTQSNVIIFVIHTQSHTQAKIINHGFRVPPPPLTPPGMCQQEYIIITPNQIKWSTKKGPCVPSSCLLVLDTTLCLCHLKWQQNNCCSTMIACDKPVCWEDDGFITLNAWQWQHHINNTCASNI